MGNLPASERRARKRESPPEPPKNQKVKSKKNKESDKESSDVVPKLDTLSALLRGTPLSNVNDDTGCKCNSDLDSDSSNVDEESDDGWSGSDDEGDDNDDDDNDDDDDDNSVEGEESWEDMESWQDTDSDEDDSDNDGSKKSENSSDPNKSKSQQGSSSSSSSQKPSTDRLPSRSGLKSSEDDTSEEEDDFFKMQGESDESAVSISDCEADDWMPSCSQMADILSGLLFAGKDGEKDPEKREAMMVRNAANVVWKKNLEDLAMSYVPSVESPGVPSFTQFVPTRKPIDEKRLFLVRREYFQYKTGAFGLKTDMIDPEKPWVRKADQLLADYIADLNKPGGLSEQP